MTLGPAVLSVDFELLGHLPAYRSARGEADDPTVGIGQMGDLLAAFDEYGATATFFVVGDITEQHPEVVRRAANAGHEIGSHSYTHPHLSALDDQARVTEFTRSRTALEEASGGSVTGFRAPSFDRPAGHFAGLQAAGYEYDSSVVPSRRIPGWYGGDSQQHRPIMTSDFSTETADIAELPVSVMPGLRLPLTGTWLRFFGVRYTLLGMRWLARRGIAPVLYVHPWEFADLPPVDGMARRVYWRTGDWMARALERILAQPFDFVTAASLLDERLPAR